jgi:sugar lactone lactonase YvrE
VRTGLITLGALCACNATVVAPARRAPPPEPVVATTADLTGGRIVATATGAFVIDADSGVLFELDDAARTAARVAIGRDAGQLVYDPARDVVFVADRRGDRVVVVDGARRVVARWRTPAEPFGLALTADRQTLLVTTIADRTLVALDARTGAERWRAALSPGARGVSASPGGGLAIVGSIATSTIDVVELAGAHRVASVPFDLACERCEAAGAFARGTGTVRFLDGTRAVATFQRSIPEALIERHTDVYGAGSRPPVTQHVAFFTFSATGAAEMVAQLAENQPRSLGWDRARDTIYVAGHGSDTLLALPGVSQGDPDRIEASASDAVLRAHARCGPDGLAVTGDGKLLLWCSFTRTVLRLDPARDDLAESAPLVASSFTDAQHDGLVLFHATNPAINGDRALACASCHFEGLADGLSWKIGAQALQTPVLAGRLIGTAPYRWDGSAATLDASLASTVHRLGGAGLTPGQRDALAAYLESLPRPRTPTRDADAIERGRLVFEGDGGCVACHRGAAFSDGEQHQFASTLEHANTPSLIGLWSSAPYYHDGSAATLDQLLRGQGDVHGMIDAARLTDAQRADLQTFLESR